MKEYEPRIRAGFLAAAYRSNPGEFKRKTPDEMLVAELGADMYVRLANEHVVPIAAIPAGIMLSHI